MLLGKEKTIKVEEDLPTITILPSPSVFTYMLLCFFRHIHATLYHECNY